MYLSLLERASLSAIFLFLGRDFQFACILIVSYPPIHKTLTHSDDEERFTHLYILHRSLQGFVVTYNGCFTVIIIICCKRHGSIFFQKLLHNPLTKALILPADALHILRWYCGSGPAKAYYCPNSRLLLLPSCILQQEAPCKGGAHDDTHSLL